MRLQLRHQPGPQATGGLTGAARSASKTAHSHGWQVCAGCWQEASGLRVRVSSPHAASFPPAQMIPESKGETAASFMTQPWKLHIITSPSSFLFTMGGGEYQEARTSGGQPCRLVTHRTRSVRWRKASHLNCFCILCVWQLVSWPIHICQKNGYAAELHSGSLLLYYLLSEPLPKKELLALNFYSKSSLYKSSLKFHLSIKSLWRGNLKPKVLCDCLLHQAYHHEILPLQFRRLKTKCAELLWQTRLH